MNTFPALERIKSERGIVSFKLPAQWADSLEAYFERNDKKTDGRYTVSIKSPRKVRSTGKGSQNHRVNGFCQQIATSTGQPFDDIKKRAKQLAVDMGYPILSDDAGNPIYDLWGNVQGVSEGDDISTTECIYLIDAVEQIAAFCDVRLYEGEYEN